MSLNRYVGGPMPASVPLSNGQLTHQAVSDYWENGFVFPITVFSEAETATS
ncbi:hypothetical protein [Ruegeria arenilitoris]|uniref:hypothetical protein n=1 Tax=Ruegeria arenilitoris TaxID=1173585 RepID=UPI0020C35350|nr:hypothetical protein [Ruegeria arenilitoris]